MTKKEIYQYEIELEKKWRKTKWLIPAISIVTSMGFLFAIWTCLHYYEKGHWWTVFIAGLFAHSFFIVALHDASHKSITRHQADRWIMNIAAGFLLLPFFGEAFRNSHLIHHSNSNSEYDPLWHEDKQYLFKKSRLFYVLCELIPLVFTTYLTLRSRNKRESASKKIKGPGINYWFVLMASGVSLFIIFYLKPSLWFCIGMIFMLNFFAKLRHWSEHLGTDSSGTNNTFWYPLGMGVGNHDTHHYAAFISWPVLAIGLLKRKKNSNPFYAFYGVLFKKDFIHYTEEGNLIDKNRLSS